MINILFIPSLNREAKSSFLFAFNNKTELSKKLTKESEKMCSFVWEDLNQLNISSLKSIEEIQRYEEYILQRLNKFLKIQGTKKIIALSIGGGFLEHLIKKHNVAIDFNDTSILFFKPFFFNRIKLIDQIRGLENLPVCREVKEHLTQEEVLFSRNYYYVYGDQDVITGKFEETFNNKKVHSDRVKVLKNSTHFPTNDEFPQFRDFYFDFLKS